MLIHIAFPALGFCPNFHDVAPFAQLNIKLLIISPRRGLPHGIFIYLENYLVSLGAQAVNTEESVYILCQMFIYFEFFFFYFLRHKLDLVVEPRCRSLTAEKWSGASYEAAVNWPLLSSLRMWGTFIFQQQGMKNR